MSNEEHMDQQMAKSGAKSGQSRRRDLALDQLNDNEREVVRALAECKRRMKIREIQEFLGWMQPTRAKGNSRVRNALRRLVGAGIVLHDKAIGDGTYVAAMVGPNPMPLTRVELEALEEDYRVSDSLKKTDCSFYNACLDQAISGKWDGFGCKNCTAYQEIDPFQKQMDCGGLYAVMKAVEEVSRTGKVNRKRGVKEGADAKRTPRLKVVEDPKVLVEALAAE